MPNRWFILFVLFFARVTMAFQFQSVAALSPLIADTYGLSLADIGLLIGLYFAPGVLVALPGGVIAARFGEKRVIGWAMGLMALGALVVMLGTTWEVYVVGRILASVGGVIINIVLTKLLVDWFAGREISTAMAIFINSWPIGIALALVTLPTLAAVGGLLAANLAVLAIILVGGVLFLAFYVVPEGAAQGATSIQAVSLPLYALSLASLIWALYNTALAMVFSFGPALLTEKGWSLTAAGSVTSVFMIVLSLVLPVGGIIADKTGRRDLVIVASLLGFAVLIPSVAVLPGYGIFAIFVVVGAIFALGAGPIMTMPSAILPPEARTFGMGVFFTIYYAVMMIAPRIAGGVADATGSTLSAFLIGAGLCAICVPMVWAFRRAEG